MTFTFLENLKRSWVSPATMTPTQVESINWFAMNLAAGTPLLTALDMARHGIPCKEYRDAMDALYKALSEGAPMLDALKQPACAVLPILVKIVLLTDLTDVEKGDILYRKYTRSVFDTASLEALASYIILVGCMFILACFSLFAFVLPQFREIYSGIALPLPKFTQFLLKIADFCNTWGPLILLIAVSIIVGIIHLMKKPVFKQLWLGAIGVRKAVFSEILYVLSSVPPERTLSLIKNLTDSPLFQEAAVCTNAFSEALENGYPVDTILIRHGIDPQAAWLVRLAVEGRGMTESFGLAAELIETRLKARIQELETLVKVLLVMGCAILCGSVAVGVFAPLVELVGMI